MNELTIEQQDLVAMRLAGLGSTSDDSGIGRAGRPANGRLAASFGQRQLWFLEQLMPGTHMHTVRNLWSIDGPLDIPALRHALNTIWQRHDALRVAFHDDGGEPYAAVGAPRPIGLDVVDLTGRTPDAARAEAERSAAEDAAQGFDLSSGRLVRVRLFVLSPDHHLLMMNMHHTVIDGWSMGVLWRELSMIYTAFTTGHPSP